MAFAVSSRVGCLPDTTARPLKLCSTTVSPPFSRPVTRRPRPRHCNPPQAALATEDLPVSVVSIKDAATNARVYLVGCVHGSTVSGEDVSTLISSVGPDVVVLELCAGRLRSLKKSMRDGTPRNRQVKSLGEMVKQFGGLGPALLGGSLSLIYTFQSWLGGDPGLEFKAALDSASPFGSTVVCGDMKATRTVRRLFGVIFRPVKSLRNFPRIFRLAAESVLFLPDNAISIPKVLLDVRRVPEVVRVFLPLFAAVSVLSTGLGVAATEVGDRVLLSPLLFSAVSGVNFEPILSTLSYLQPVFSAYSIITFLSFFKVLVADRDKILAKSIRASAVEAAASGADTSTDNEVVVVAVLGLMHLNGIIRLLEAE